MATSEEHKMLRRGNGASSPEPPEVTVTVTDTPVLGFQPLIDFNVFKPLGYRGLLGK